MELGYPWTVSILNIWSGLCSVAAACLRLHYSSFSAAESRRKEGHVHIPQSIHPSIQRSTRRSIMRCQVPFFIFYSRRKLGLGRDGDVLAPIPFPRCLSLHLSPPKSVCGGRARRWRPIQFASRDESSILTERRMDGSQWEEDWEERRQKGWTDGVSKREGEGGGR